MSAPDVLKHVGAIADRFAESLETVQAEVDGAIIKAIPALGRDAAIRAEVRASTLGNLGRFIAAARDQLDGRPLLVAPEAVDLARSVVRRGLDKEVVPEAYRVGQQVAWAHWMRIAGCVVHPASDLPLVLEVSLDALFRYVDRAVDAVNQAMEVERASIAGGDLAARAEAVRLLLDGAPLDVERASRVLRHELAGYSTAMIVWRHGPAAERAVLEPVAGAAARAAGAAAPVTLRASEDVLWAWMATTRPLAVSELDGLREGAQDGVCMALGPSRKGALGFRRSHEAALAVHRLLATRPEAAPVMTYEDLEVAVLASQDEERAREFVTATLGDLAGHDPGAARLRESLRVFLEEADNAPRAAVRLHTHRNTVLKRVARAEELLGHRAGERRLAVALALELHRWIQV